MEDLDSNLEFKYSDFYYEKYCSLVQEYLHQVILHQVTIDSKDLHVNIQHNYIPSISSSIVDMVASIPFVNTKGMLCMATHIVLVRKGIHIPLTDPNMFLLKMLFDELYITDRATKYIDLYGAPIEIELMEDEDPFKLLCNDSDPDFLDFIDEALPSMADTYLFNYKYCINQVKLLSVLHRNLAYSYLSKISITMIDKECATVMTEIAQDSDTMVNLVIEGNRINKLARRMYDNLCDNIAITSTVMSIFQQKLSCNWSIDTSDRFKLVMASAIGVDDCEEIDNMLAVAETMKYEMILDVLPTYYILDAGFAIGLSLI